MFRCVGASRSIFWFLVMFLFCFKIYSFLIPFSVTVPSYKPSWLPVSYRKISYRIFLAIWTIRCIRLLLCVFSCSSVGGCFATATSSTAGERSEDYCQVMVDISRQQGFISDSDINFHSALNSESPVECVWILHAPVGFRVSHIS